MDVISIISKVSPVLGSALGGPAGGAVGLLISKVLGVDLKKPDEVKNIIDNDPDSLNKLKELEMQLSDMQQAREQASKETGALRFVRPILALAAMCAIFINIFAIKYVVEDTFVKEILLVMMVFLVWDIRQIYKFYFGNEEEVPGFLLRNKR